MAHLKLATNVQFMENADKSEQKNHSLTISPMVSPIASLHCSEPAKTEKELESQNSVQTKHGGWRAFPFIIGNELCSATANTGLAANMIVYLTTQFNIKNIQATHIVNISNGGNDLAPLIGAYLADTYLGRYWAVSFGSVVSLLAMVTLTLTAAINGLRPLPCSGQLQAQGSCHGPSKPQYAILFLYFAFTAIASGGIRYNTLTFGADQFQKRTKKGMKDIQSFFNWYYFVLYISIMMSTTVIVYIQASVSWAWGFGVCSALTCIAMVLFFSGTKLYNRLSPEGNLFTGFAQVVVASVRKRHLQLPSSMGELYHEQKSVSRLPVTPQLSFLNKAAIKAPEDFSENGHIDRNPWRLCTIDQVEELKSILKTIPIWFCGIVPAIMNTQNITFSVLQALTMDRHLGPHFQIPAASFVVFGLLSSALWLSIYDRVVVPLAIRRGKKITQLQRIGIGLVIYILGFAVSSIVEKKRLKTVETFVKPTFIVPMSALWLIPQHVIMGLGDAFYRVGMMDFFYSEFAGTVRSTATALVGAGTASGFYFSSLMVSIVHKNTHWLPDNPNEGKLHYFYALLCVMGAVNCLCFVACGWGYKYNAKENSPLDESTP